MTDDRRVLASTGLALADLAALRALWPDLGALAHDVAAPHAWVTAAGADGAASTLTGAALWCVALWLGAGLLAAVATSLPGGFGRISRSVSRVLLPAAVYRVVAGAAGLGVLLAPLGAGAAGIAAVSARPPGGGTPAVTASTPPPIPAPSWPGDAARPAPTLPVPGWPGSGAPASAPSSANGPAQPRQPAGASSPGRGVVVGPGDSLWRIAAARLGDRSTPRQIAASWPRWYAANRTVIGADPDLIKPGQLLQAPVSTQGPK